MNRNAWDGSGLPKQSFGPLQSQWSIDDEVLLSEKSVRVTRSQLTKETQRKFNNSIEYRCRQVFDQDDVTFPSCFIVLPYELNLDPRTNMLVVPSKDHIDLAVQLGRCFLNINKATAKLSFWLIMKRHLSQGQAFKSKLKEWLRRARIEPTDLVATEIVDEISCGSEYVPLCQEVLEEKDSISNAKAFITDPMNAARKEVKDAVENLLRCYVCTTHYFYIIDEFRGVPAASACFGEFGSLYPLRIGANAQSLEYLFLPFMSVSIMTISAVDGLASLANLFGIPLSCGIPMSWKNGEAGLIHRSEQPESVIGFGRMQRHLLQPTVEKPSYFPSPSDRPFRRRHSSAGMVRWADGGLAGGLTSEVRQLKRFYREHDPLRRFSDFRRVCDESGRAIWTSEDMLEKMQSEVELVRTQERLRQLKEEWSRKKQIEDEINALTAKVKAMKSSDAISVSRSSTKSRGSSKRTLKTGSVSTHTYTTEPGSPLGEKVGMKDFPIPCKPLSWVGKNIKVPGKLRRSKSVGHKSSSL